MSNIALLEDVGPGPQLPGFDIDDPVLPPEIARQGVRSGGYPYDKRMKRKGTASRSSRCRSSSSEAAALGRAAEPAYRNHLRGATP